MLRRLSELHTTGPLTDQTVLLHLASWYRPRPWHRAQFSCILGHRARVD